MISYEQVMKVTADVSAPAAFEEPCCRLMYDTVSSLQPGSTIVEVGVEYGRSTSILAQVAKDQDHRLILIDPFVDPLSGVKAMEMLCRIGCEFTLHKMPTAHLGQRYDGVHLVHIDGDHTREGITLDCNYWLPWLHVRGYACFHDYARDSLPEVMPTVDSYVRNDAWEEIGHANTLLVMRRK